MTYYKKNGYSTMTKYKKKGYRKNYTSKIWDAIKKINQKLLAESKLVRFTSGAYFANDASTASIHLTNIAQGDAVTQREGNQVGVRMLTGNLLFDALAAGTATNNQQFVRVVIFIDNQQENGVNPAYTEVFTAATPQATLWENAFGRYSIIYDKIVKVDLQGSNASQCLRINLKIKPVRKVRFNNVGIQKNGFYMFMLGDGDNTDAQSVKIRYVMNTYFYDN